MTQVIRRLNQRTIQIQRLYAHSTSIQIQFVTNFLSNLFRLEICVYKFLARPVDNSTSHLFLQATTTNHFEEDMASKNAVVQSSRKATRSTSQGSTAVSAASGRVMTRSMAKAAASSAKEPAVATATSKLRNAPNGNSKIVDGVTQIASDALKQKSVVGFNMPQTIPRGMDELQTHTNPAFQPFNSTDEGYSSSDSSLSTSKESTFFHAEAESSDTVVMPVMVTEAANVEEQLASMRTTLDRLARESAEKDAQIKRQNEQIAELMKRLEKKSSEASNKDSDEEDSDKESNRAEESDDERKARKDRSLGSMSVEQIQNLIANAVKAQLGEGSRKTNLYTKPYTKRIDSLRMPHGYQPPKFNQFDGKGNPKQHIAHFIETCSNAGTEGDRLVKQFVRSLKGIAFDWYTDLEPESINSWEQMEHEFLNRFYSTQRTVSMTELTNTKQWKDEPVLDYINRWRSLSLECKDRLTEASAVEMCAQGMEWDLLYVLQMSKPRTFQELATKAHDMEMTIANRRGKSSSSYEIKKDKGETKKSSKPSKASTKELPLRGLYEFQANLG